MAVKSKRRVGLKITERVEQNLVEEQSEKSFLPLDLRRSKISLIIGILVVLAVLFYFKGLFVVATVNGQPLSRLSLVQELEKQGGKQTLNRLITQTLIFQEAQKKNITVSEGEIDQEIKKIEANLAQQGQTFDQVLALQGMTKQNLREQIKIEKIIQKMLNKDTAVTDEEVASYMETNKDTIPESTDEAQLKESIKQQLQQQKLSTKFQEWLASVQKSAKINYFVQY